MSWLQDEEDSPLDEGEKLLKDFSNFIHQLKVNKHHVEFLRPEDTSKGLSMACWAHHLINDMNLEEANLVLWVTTDMQHTTEGGRWTRTIYQDNEGTTLRTVRELAEHLNIPTENVLFTVPEDEFMRDKIAEFVSHAIDKFDPTKHFAIAWLPVKDQYHKSILKRMLV